MKTVIVMMLLSLIVKITIAQDTAYVSRDKATALFFPGAVKVLGNTKSSYRVTDKGNGVLTVKARVPGFKIDTLRVQDQSSKKIYLVPVAYSYGRAGRRIGYGSAFGGVRTNDRQERSDQFIVQQLATGKRSDIAARQKKGGIKAWINKVSLARDRIYLRLDLRNRSNLPYGIDFVRFYIRDRKTVERMATHEQEIMPLYSTLRSHTAVIRDQEVAEVFAFKRFSLADDQALFIEVYERSGNRHFYLQLKQDDLDEIKVIPEPDALAPALAASH